MSSVSGTSLFDMEIDEIISEAYTRVKGGGHITGAVAKDARRSLNIMLLDLINRGVPLASMEEKSITMVSGTNDYTCSSDIMAIMHTVLERSSIETAMNHISLFEYKDIPNKATTGRPTQYTVIRDRDYCVLRVWPRPENSTDIIKFWALTKIDDVDAQDQLVDLPTRFLPAIISGLAYYLSLKEVDIEINTIERLKREYEETLMRAMEEDRERSSFFTCPLIEWK